MKTRTKATLAALAATATIGGGVVAVVPTATAAATGSGTVATHGVSLSVNDAPRLQSNRRGWVKAGQRVTISCQVYGDYVDGKWGRTNLWNYVNNLGYASDGWIDTGTNGRLSGVPECGSKPSPSKPAQPNQPGRPSQSSQPAAGYQYPFTGTFYLPYAKGSAYSVTQTPFGAYTHNPNHSLGRWNKYAVDLGMPAGTPVLATGPGQVRYAGWDTTGYGNKVLIDHGNNRCTQFGHLSAINVKVGDKVTTGRLVAHSGNTGLSTGAHLHWGIVRCDTGVSIETPRTVETGTSYRLNAVLKSANPGR